MGILFSILHATFDYYIIENRFLTLQKDVKYFFSNQLGWEVLVDRIERPLPYNWLMHMLGWLGGIVFFAGLLLGVLQIR